jgi:hypothetical protein
MQMWNPVTNPVTKYRKKGNMARPSQGAEKSPARRADIQGCTPISKFKVERDSRY